MLLKYIKITGIRNLHETSVHFTPRFNLIFGKNGSGKTSFLEAIHLLATGRSFRCSSASEFINFDKNQCVVMGESLKPQYPIDLPSNKINHDPLQMSSYKFPAHYDYSPTHLGIERKSDGGVTLKVGHEKCASLGEYAQILPLQMINTNTYQLLEGSSSIRRQFMDWGMFHVEHLFFPTWQKYSRVLKQRNAALKRAKFEGVKAVMAWDHEFCEFGEQLNLYRQEFISSFIPILQDVMNSLGYCEGVQIKYKEGWNIQGSLSEILAGSLEQDLIRGYTQFGPHRGDLEFLIDNTSIETIFSRGQQKLFISALMMARARWFLAKAGRQSVFLVDDLGSELDRDSSHWLLEQLYIMGGQVILTSIEPELVKNYILSKELLVGNDADFQNTLFKMFHVEHGVLNEVCERGIVF